jgi:hypothetical protein
VIDAYTDITNSGGFMNLQKEFVNALAIEGLLHKDLSLRDYLAMKSMIQMVANGQANSERIAAISYSIADEMIKQREVKQTGEKE